MGLDIYIFLKTYEAPYQLQVNIPHYSSDKNYQELAWDSTGLRAQPSLQMPDASLRATYISDQLTINLGISMTISGSVILLNNSQNSQKVLYL